MASTRRGKPPVSAATLQPQFRPAAARRITTQPVLAPPVRKPHIQRRRSSIKLRRRYSSRLRLREPVASYRERKRLPAPAPGQGPNTGAAVVGSTRLTGRSHRAVSRCAGGASAGGGYESGPDHVRRRLAGTKQKPDRRTRLRKLSTSNPGTPASRL